MSKIAMLAKLLEILKRHLVATRNVLVVSTFVTVLPFVFRLMRRRSQRRFGVDTERDTEHDKLEENVSSPGDKLDIDPKPNSSYDNSKENGKSLRDEPYYDIEYKQLDVSDNEVSNKRDTCEAVVELEGTKDKVQSSVANINEVTQMSSKRVLMTMSESTTAKPLTSNEPKKYLPFCPMSLRKSCASRRRLQPGQLIFDFDFAESGLMMDASYSPNIEPYSMHRDNFPSIPGNSTSRKEFNKHKSSPPKSQSPKSPVLLETKYFKLKDEFSDLLGISIWNLFNSFVSKSFANGGKDDPSDGKGDREKDDRSDGKGDGEKDDPSDGKGDGEKDDPSDGDGEKYDPSDGKGDGEKDDPSDRKGDGGKDDPSNRKGDGGKDDPSNRKEDLSDGKGDEEKEDGDPSKRKGDRKRYVYASPKMLKSYKISLSRLEIVLNDALEDTLGLRKQLPSHSNVITLPQKFDALPPTIQFPSSSASNRAIGNPSAIGATDSSSAIGATDSSSAIGATDSSSAIGSSRPSTSRGFNAEEGTFFTQDTSKDNPPLSNGNVVEDDDSKYVEFLETMIAIQSSEETSDRNGTGPLRFRVTDASSAIGSFPLPSTSRGHSAEGDENVVEDNSKDDLPSLSNVNVTGDDRRSKYIKFLENIILPHLVSQHLVFYRTGPSTIGATGALSSIESSSLLSTSTWHSAKGAASVVQDKSKDDGSFLSNVNVAEGEESRDSVQFLEMIMIDKGGQVAGTSDSTIEETKLQTIEGKNLKSEDPAVIKRRHLYQEKSSNQQSKKKT